MSAGTRFGTAPVLVVLAAVGGILAGERAGPASSPLVFVGGGLLAAAVAARGDARVVFAVLGVALAALGATQRALQGEADARLAAMARRAPVVAVDGTLASDPTGPAYLTTAVLRVHRVAFEGESGRAQSVDERVLVRATGTDAGEWRVLAEGDEVQATGVVQPLVGRDRDERWRHVVAVLGDARLARFTPPRAPPLVVANALRAAVQRGSATVDPVDRGLLAGFLLGDTRAIPNAVTGEFRASGLTHLLAVSGENVAFVLALAGPVLRRASLRGRLILGLAILVVFGFATRFEPSGCAPR